MAISLPSQFRTLVAKPRGKKKEADPSRDERGCTTAPHVSAELLIEILEGLHIASSCALAYSRPSESPFDSKSRNHASFA